MICSLTRIQWYECVIEKCFSSPGPSCEPDEFGPAEISSSPNLLFLLSAVQNDGAAATPWTHVQGRTRQIIVLSWRLINDVLVLITLVTFCELQIFPLLFLWLGSDGRCARRCQKPSAEAVFHPFSTRPDFSSHVFLPLKGKSRAKYWMWWTSHIKYRHVNGPQRGKNKTKQKNHREFQTVLETEAS